MGQSRFAEYQHLAPGRDWADDLDWTRVYLQPDDLVVHYPVNAYAETSRSAADVRTNGKLANVHRDLYLRCCGWWPPGVLERDERQPFSGERSLSEVLLAENLELDSVKHEVNGRRCWRLKVASTDSVDLLWLDCERSCVLVKREYTVPDGRLILESEDFVEAKPGVWLPMRVRQRVFGRREGDAAGSIVEYPTADAWLSLSELEVNAATAADFRFEPAPGTLIRDTDARKMRQIPGGLEILEGILQVTRKDITDSDAEPRLSSNRTLWIVGGALWIAAIVVAVFLNRSTAWRRGGH